MESKWSMFKASIVEVSASQGKLMPGYWKVGSAQKYRLLSMEYQGSLVGDPRVDPEHGRGIICLILFGNASQSPKGSWRTRIGKRTPGLPCLICWHRNAVAGWMDTYSYCKYITNEECQKVNFQSNMKAYHQHIVLLISITVIQVSNCSASGSKVKKVQEGLGLHTILQMK